MASTLRRLRLRQTTTWLPASECAGILLADTVSTLAEGCFGNCSERWASTRGVGASTWISVCVCTNQRRAELHTRLDIHIYTIYSWERHARNVNLSWPLKHVARLHAPLFHTHRQGCIHIYIICVYSQSGKCQPFWIFTLFAFSIVFYLCCVRDVVCGKHDLCCTLHSLHRHGESHSHSIGKSSWGRQRRRDVAPSSAILIYICILREKSGRRKITMDKEFN